MLHSIKVQKATKDRMAELKAPGQSYDGFITQMLELWEKQKGVAPMKKRRSGETG